ncbi:MAG: hypothetical protein K2Q06_06830, partial [Parvularculaceae bacterium]|nr:hypothetical protein [Parvularculaceae bacterium]
PLIGARGAPWTADAPLPGGDIPDADFDGFFARLQRDFAWMDARRLKRLARAYGTRARILLEGAASAADLGEDFGGGLAAREVDYLRRYEYAQTAEDILWRRSKLALHAPAETARRVDAYLASR